MLQINISAGAAAYSLTFPKTHQAHSSLIDLALDTGREKKLQLSLKCLLMFSYSACHRGFVVVVVLVVAELIFSPPSLTKP